MAPLDRLERLTDLVLVLLNTSRPLSLDAIAHQLPGYPEDHDARRQAFERDKRLLREEGIPVATEPLEGEEQFGYRIHPDSFYLPDLALEPDERTALHLAVAGVHLGDPSGRQALAKLGATGLAEARPVAAFVPPPALVPLFDAVRQRAEVSFGYRGEGRRLTPSALWFRDGRWYVVGWDAVRGDARTFRVDRIDGEVASGPPGSGELPDRFDPATAAPDEPWRRGEGGEGDVRLRVDAIEGPRVIEEVGEHAVEERGADGSALLRLGVSSPDALRSWVLGLLDHAEVTAPPSWRQHMIEWLEALARQPPRPSGNGDPSALAGSGRPRAPERSGGRGSAPAPGGPADHPAPGGPAAPAGPSRPRRLRDASERLRRLLAIVGWLAAVGEAPIAEVARRFEIPEDELVHELELAACCGTPPYTPDVLMEIEVTDDAVRAHLPDDLARPRRLTPAEGFALAAAARTILAAPGADEDGSLARALAKLEVVLGDRADLVLDLDAPSLLAAVRQGVDRGERLRIQYHSASSDQTTTRVVDPLRVVSIDGHWYLDAECRRAEGTRRFRVDRIRSVEMAGPRPSSGAPPATLTGDAFVPGPDARTVRLVVDRSASWVAESVPVLHATSLEDGRQELTLSVGGRAWLERLLLQVGAHAVVIEPPDLADVGPTAARRVLYRYRSPDRDWYG